MSSSVPVLDFRAHLSGILGWPFDVRMGGFFEAMTCGGFVIMMSGGIDHNM